MSVPVWGATLSGPLPVVALVGRYPTNQLMGRRPLLKRLLPAFEPGALTPGLACGLSSPFELLFPTSGQVTYVLRTHSPLSPSLAGRAAFDLHVLSTPPAFILSQDQTLRRELLPIILSCDGAEILIWQLTPPCELPQVPLIHRRAVNPLKLPSVCFLSHLSC